jgi:hypothetical protein
MTAEYTSRWPPSDEARKRQPATAGRGPTLTRNLGAPGAGVCIVAIGGNERAARHHPIGGFR